MRFGSILEWVLAAAVIVAALTGASVLFREVRSLRAVVPVIAGESFIHESPAGIPSRSVSVPMLLLGNGREVRLGDRASEVAARLGGASQLLSESLDRSASRVTRFYNDVGVQFVLVFEALERNAEPRVAAIYLR